jgi:hypothetical protein
VKNASKLSMCRCVRKTARRNKPEYGCDAC